VAAVEVRGTPFWNLVRGSDGRPVGWYVYYLARGGIAQTLQIAAPRGDVGLVFDDLSWHAASRGAVALSGRVESALLPALLERRIHLGGSNWALAHSKRPDVLAAVGLGGALLTRLDGEWWMGHHLLWRGDGSPRHRRLAMAP